MQLFVELEAAGAQHDALAGLDGLLGASLEELHADDFLVLRVLDQVLFGAVELQLDGQAQFRTLGLKLVERRHAEALDAGHADAASILAVVQEPILGDGAGQSLLGDLVRHAVLVGVVGVLRGLGDVGVDHVLFDESMAERDAVFAEQFGILDDRPLAVVDAAVAATFDGCLLEHDDFRAAFVGSDEGSPHARSAVTNDDDVGLVVPRRRHPVGCSRGARARTARRATSQGSRAGQGGTGEGSAFQEVATRQSFTHEFLLACERVHDDRRSPRRRPPPCWTTRFAMLGILRARA